MIDIAREKGVSAYVGDGKNRWSASHLSDTARLYRLALDKGSAGCYHAVAEEGVPASRYRRGDRSAPEAAGRLENPRAGR